MRCSLQTFLFLCLALPASAGSALAADMIYRWVDAAGVVHFSNQPPPGVAATIVTTGNPPAARPPATEPAPEAQQEAQQEAGEEELSYAEQRRRERAERRQRSSEEQRRIDGQCEIMRRQLAWVEPNPRVLVNDEQGNPRRLNDDEREDLINEARSFIAENCD